MGKIIFDYGHGGNDSGAVLGSRYEKNDVLKIGKDVRKILINHGITVDETRSTDKTISLQERCNIANSKDYEYFISFHRNAFNKQANGVETFTYTNKNSHAIILATNINNAMVKVGFKNRGVKSANFKVLRSTKAKAVLMEIGFIDNKTDNNIFDNSYNDLVNGIANAILDTLGVKAKVEPKDNLFYRVVTGSYENRANAENRVKELKMKGFDSFIDIYRG